MGIEFPGISMLREREDARCLGGSSPTTASDAAGQEPRLLTMHSLALADLI